MTDRTTEGLFTFLTDECGYTQPRVLPSGEVAALNRFLFTVGMLVGVDRTGYRTRFCYPNYESASEAIQQWDGAGDPPGPWIKEKGSGGDRNNPMKFCGIPVEASRV